MYIEIIINDTQMPIFREKKKKEKNYLFKCYYYYSIL